MKKRNFLVFFFLLKKYFFFNNFFQIIFSNSILLWTKYLGFSYLLEYYFTLSIYYFLQFSLRVTISFTKSSNVIFPQFSLSNLSIISITAFFK